MKILIIEDDTSIQYIMKEFIETFLNKQCFIAGSIDEAKDAYKKYNPSLVFLDILLKDANAEVLIKEFQNTSHVVIMSAWNKAEQIAQEFKVDDFVSKPFDLDTIEKIIFKKSS